MSRVCFPKFSTLLAGFTLTFASCSSSDAETDKQSDPTVTTLDTRVKNAPLDWSINPPKSNNPCPPGVKTPARNCGRP
jgi:hypothetical protein